MFKCINITQSFYCRAAILIFWFFLLTTNAYSQQASIVGIDTPAVLIDTFNVDIPDSLPAIQLDSSQVLKKQKQKQKTKKLVKIFSFFRYKDNGQRKDFIGAEKYKKFKGKKIHSIRIEILKPFVDPDDSSKQLSKVKKFGNKIHFLSKERYIKSDILFKEGDKVNPSLFVDTEKLLWDRRKFKDINISLEIDSISKEVDVVVYLQDNLSWVVGLGYNNRVIFGISAYNFFGQPNSISVFTGVNYNKYNLWAVGGSYKYENIKKSQISFNTSFLVEKLNQQASVSVNRNFFSIRSQWAFDVKYNYNYITRSLTGKRLDIENYRSAQSNFYSLWLAYAMPVAKIFSIKDDRLKIIVATKINRIDFKKRPFLSNPVYDKIFINQQNYTFGIGVARWDYYLARNTFYIDFAEYFPRGYSTSFWIGHQIDEVFGKRISLDFTVNYGIHLENVGYFYPQYNFNGYVRHKKGEQMISRISLDFVSDKVNFAKIVYFRQLLKMVTNIGSVFPEERYFNINDANGIRGFYSPPLKGSKSVVINAECDFFIDKKIAYSKFMTYAFCDLAWLAQNNKTLFTQSVFQFGIGFGLKLRSASVGIPYLDMQLGFYPRGKSYGKGLVQPNVYGNNMNAIRQNNMLVE